MDSQDDASLDKATYLARIDEIINNSLLAAKTKTKTDTPNIAVVSPQCVTTNIPTTGVPTWIRRSQSQQHSHPGTYMSSVQAKENEGADLTAQENESQDGAEMKEEQGCEEGEIRDTDEEENDVEDDDDGDDDEYYDSDEEAYEEEHEEEEDGEVDYEQWHEHNDSRDGPEEKDTSAKKEKPEELSTPASMDDNINMNLQTMKKSAIDKQEKQNKLNHQMQTLCCRIVREFGNSAKLTVLKERLHTNMEKLTKVFSKYKHVFRTFTHSGCAHVKVLPELGLCEDYCRRMGCTKGDCEEIHACKFYLLGQKCGFGRKENSCRYGHTVRSQHNAPMLTHFLLDKLEADELVSVLRQWRTHATIPKVCKHYNFETGCRHNAEGEGCVALHVCKYFIKGECRFAESCIRSHSLLDEQPAALLRKCGLDPSDSETSQRLTECYEKGVCIMPYIPFVSEKPKPKPKPRRQPVKIRKKGKRKRSEKMKGLKIRITQDIRQNFEEQGSTEQAALPLYPFPHPRFIAPPFNRPPGPSFEVTGPFSRPPHGPPAGLMPGPIFVPFPGGPHGPSFLGPPLQVAAGHPRLLSAPPLLPPPPPVSPAPGGLLPTPATSPPIQSLPESSFLSPPPDTPSKFDRPTFNHQTESMPFEQENRNEFAEEERRPENFHGPAEEHFEHRDRRHWSRENRSQSERDLFRNDPLEQESHDQGQQHYRHSPQRFGGNYYEEHPRRRRSESGARGTDDRDWRNQRKRSLSHERDFDQKFLRSSYDDVDERHRHSMQDDLNQQRTPHVDHHERPGRDFHTRNQNLYDRGDDEVNYRGKTFDDDEERQSSRIWDDDVLSSSRYSREIEQSDEYGKHRDRGRRSRLDRSMERPPYGDYPSHERLPRELSPRRDRTRRDSGRDLYRDDLYTASEAGLQETMFPRHRSPSYSSSHVGDDLSRAQWRSSYRSLEDDHRRNVSPSRPRYGDYTPGRRGPVRREENDVPLRARKRRR